MDCIVCHEPFNAAAKTPLVLPCNHTLCKECCGVLYRAPHQPCPVCRAPVPVTHAELKPNFQLMDVVNSRDTKVCEQCQKKGGAVVACDRCGVELHPGAC